MSEAPELLWLWPAEPEDGVDKFVSFPGQPYPSDSTTYIRADLADALLREAVEALENRDGGRHDDDCKASRPINGMCNCGHDEARTTLAKLRAHLGDKE